MNLDFKFEVFPSHQHRKTNSFVCFLGKLWFNNFALGPTDLYNDKRLSNNNFSMTPLHAWLEQLKHSPNVGGKYR